MIPVFQTRTAVETFGNCFEACLASILEVPLSKIPDRADYVGDLAAWAALVEKTRRERGDKALFDLEYPEGVDVDWRPALDAWLLERGLLLVAAEWKRPADSIGWTTELADAYWIGTWTVPDAGLHSVVMRGARVVHNPTRGVLGEEGMERLLSGFAFVMADVRLVVRRLGGEMLPDVAGALEATEILGVPVVSHAGMPEDAILATGPAPATSRVRVLTDEGWAKPRSAISTRRFD